MKSVSCNRSSNLSSRACVGVISCGYHTGENRNQILSRVVFPLYSLGGILPQECFSGQKPMIRYNKLRKLKTAQKKT